MVDLATGRAIDLSDKISVELLDERTRQITGELFNVEHDDRYLNGELCFAAACYAICGWISNKWIARFWPWNEQWWRPTTPRRNLVKAGALIIAEIARIDRETARHAAESTGPHRRVD